MTVNPNFNAAAHPKSPVNGRFVETELTDPGLVLADDTTDPQTAAWTRRGLSPETAQRWTAAGFTAAASDDWRRCWFTAEDAAAWRAIGVDAHTARDWHDHKFSPAATAAYLEAGFSPAEAEQWRDDSLPQPPSPAGDVPPRGDGGPADLHGDELGLAARANPYADLVMPPLEVPSLRRR